RVMMAASANFEDVDVLDGGLHLLGGMG
ncbi:MAG: hypothetical protein ACI9K5_002394, partial [Gammaproteobacteria bacterium]